MALLHVAYYSDTLKMNVDMDVILPDEQGVPCKTLYLLHGMSDDHTIWQRRTSIERYVDGKQLVVIMPCVDLSWYTDMAKGYPYWTFISEELPAICHSMFRQVTGKREDTFAAGLSMGGYGALKLGLRKPENYSCVAALSSGADIEAVVNDAFPDLQPFWEDVFGEKEKIRGSFNDLFAAADELARSDRPKPRIYMWCGTEDFLYEGNVRMRDHLRSLPFDFTWEESHGTHAWGCWDAKIQDVLAWLPLKGGNA